MAAAASASPGGGRTARAGMERKRCHPQSQRPAEIKSCIAPELQKAAELERINGERVENKLHQRGCGKPDRRNEYDGPGVRGEPELSRLAEGLPVSKEEDRNAGDGGNRHG